MTPNARYAASIEILDRILAGDPAEKTLTNWARSNRYAGSKDRAAVRDIVFDCLRQKRSFMHLSGFDGARGLIAGHILAAGSDVSTVFTSERFAADVLSDAEGDSIIVEKPTAPDATRLDIPDWIEPNLRAALADDFNASLEALQNRAPLDLRLNSKKTTLKQVQTALAKEGIETKTVANTPNALRVTHNPRRVVMSEVYKNGMIEIQDAGSQGVVNALPLDGVQSVLDYCAGGGGKTLAMAASAGSGVKFDAYDQNKARMNDLPIRASRAGAFVQVLQTDPVLMDKTYDLVVLDVPCSGTGAWRRNPDGKWRFTEADLQEIIAVQSEILTKAEKLVAKGGTLAYVTCSLLREENECQIEQFLTTHENWNSVCSQHFKLTQGTDGFFLNLLQK